MHIYDVSYSPTFYNLLLAQSPTCSAYIGGPYGGSHTNFISVLSKVRKFLSWDNAKFWRIFPNGPINETHHASHLSRETRTGNYWSTAFSPKCWIFTAEMSDKEAAPEASLFCLIAAIFYPKDGVRDTWCKFIPINSQRQLLDSTHFV